MNVYTIRLSVDLKTIADFWAYQGGRQKEDKK